MYSRKHLDRIYIIALPPRKGIPGRWSVLNVCELFGGSLARPLKQPALFAYCWRMILGIFLLFTNTRRARPHTLIGSIRIDLFIRITKSIRIDLILGEFEFILLFERIISFGYKKQGNKGKQGGEAGIWA
jgi:hypothetical protein